MSKRKPHNMRARLERTCKALVSANHAAVVNIDPSGQQVLINWNIVKLLRDTGTTQLEMEYKEKRANPKQAYRAVCLHSLPTIPRTQRQSSLAHLNIKK